jgi:Cysteine-rich secretory protein family
MSPTMGERVVLRWNLYAGAAVVAVCLVGLTMAGACATAKNGTGGTDTQSPAGASSGDAESVDAGGGSSSGNPGNDEARDGGSSSSGGGGTSSSGGAASPDDSGVAGSDHDSGAFLMPEGDAGACSRWASDRADLSEGKWTGSVSACDAGDIGAPGRTHALKLVNLYRFLAGMAAVTDDPSWDSEAQQCALMQTANGLSHTPPTTWKCYTAAGADGSKRSDLSSGPGVGAIDGYMQDIDDPTTMGHRRWILNNQLGPVGFGSAVASCFMNVGGTSHSGKAFVAWPPPGQVPYAAITTTKVDQGGWTLQSDTINVNAGTVTVLDGTQNLPVSLNTLGTGYGSTYAIRFVPNGWKTQAGHDYEVSVSGTSVTYTVQVVNCP